MTLIERLWALVTSVISIVSLSPIPERSEIQTPLQPVLPISPINEVKKYPIFRPPGHPVKTFFRCEYPLMEGWEDCSHELDRRCWLRRKSDGRQLDINTDYENIWPRGIDRYYELDLADASYDADGLNFTEAKLFNGIYPGPWIEACWGDRLIVNVTNSLKHNGTSVHWHGIRQLNTTHMDGVNGITQCPIAPKDYFVYNFTLHQYGSSWYHSHYSVQYADGAAGPMTIHGPSSSDWDEAVSPPLIITDWYHNSAFQVVLNRSNNGGLDILLNGRGNITKFTNGTTKNTTVIKPARSIIFDRPRPGQGCKKYLLRVINTSFDTTFVFSIDNHVLHVVSADFVPIQPYRTTSILVGIGQRYNVVVEANPLNKTFPLADNENYWIRTEIASCFGGRAAGPGYEEVAILRYNPSSTSNPSTKKWPGIRLNCSDEPYAKLNPILPWIVNAPSNGALNAAAPRYGEAFDVGLNGRRKPLDYPLAKWAMDSDDSAPMRIDYADPIFLHLDPNDKIPFEKNQTLWRVQPENYTSDKWIYLVLHGLKSGTKGAHPIHLHGHDFAILEEAENKNWTASNMTLKLINPPRRDVVLLPTNGYVVIAFKADNPGPWLVHCHIAFHISEGLGMQIFEDQPGAFRLWPNNSAAIVETNRVCKNWKEWYSDMNNWANKPISAKGNCNETKVEDCFQDDSGV